jgi:heme exporter protein A
VIRSTDQVEPAFIVAQDIGVVFGQQVALRGISFEVSAGERVLIRGHNGAGKSTLIRVLAGLRRPDRGHVSIAGNPPHARDVRRQIGVVVHNPWLDVDLTVAETLRFFCGLYGLRDVSTRIESVLHQVDMADRIHQRVGELSRGYQQRLTLARALLHQPSVLLLDEPDTGLDEHALQTLSEVLRQPRQGSAFTIIMTSHNRAFGEAIAERTLTLERGELLDEFVASTR